MRGNGRAKRRLLGCVFLIMVGVGVGAADLNLVQAGLIEHVGEYEAELLFAVSHQQWLQHWIPDQIWDAPFTKAEYAQRVEELYQLINRHQEPDNQEYLLLRAIISEFTYHLELPDVYEQTVGHYMEIEQLPGRTYRHRWMLGSFYSKASRPELAIAEFEWVRSHFSDDSLHPEYWNDFGHAALTAHMPMTAIDCLERYYRLAGTEVDPGGLLSRLRAASVTPLADQNWPGTDLFTILQRSDGYGLFSMALGLWVPVELEWDIRNSGYNDGTSMLVFTPPIAETPSGMQVQYNLILLSYDSRHSHAATMTQGIPAFDPVEHDFDRRFEMYEYELADRYPEMGGAHGLFALIRSPVPDSPSRSIERPSRFPDFMSTGGPQYYAFLERHLTRIPTELTHFMFLDASEAVYEQAREMFFNFMSRLLVE